MQCDPADNQQHIDYEKIKSQLPKDDLADAQTVLDEVTIDEQTPEGNLTVTT